MHLIGMAVKNQIFYLKKTLLAILLVSLMLFVPAASVLLVNHIKMLADRPLQSLQTELVLQNDRSNRNAENVKTQGIILPFNLQSFSKKDATEKLNSIKEIEAYSTALILWQFDLQNNRTIVALDKDDPAIGLRKIESFLMPGSKFFSGNSSEEAILERHFSKLFGYKLNGYINILDRKFKIVGKVDFKEQSNLSNASIFIPYKTGLSLSGGNGPIINQVFISLKSSADTSRVSNIIEGLFPGYSLITKDSLYKNLSGFNRLIYSSGRYFILIIIPLSLLLVFWILKMHRLEFRSQTDILKTLGWPGREILRWLVYDTGLIIISALLIALVLTVILEQQVLPGLQISPLMDQGFKL